MPKVYAITGKGGTGKTTISALLIKYLISHDKLVLGVDADPNYNLNTKLGIEINATIGSIREHVNENKNEIPSSIPKTEWINYMVMRCLTECEGFDLLVMGRSEGAGCYCYINRVLRECIDNLMNRYDYIVIDSEAGMEHLSRRTATNTDTLVVVANPTREGILTAERIRRLSEEMLLRIKKIVLVINDIRSSVILSNVNDYINETGFDKNKIYYIPHDNEIENFSLNGSPIIRLSEKSIAYKAIAEIPEFMIGTPQNL